MSFRGDARHQSDGVRKGRRGPNELPKMFLSPLGGLQSATKEQYLLLDLTSDTHFLIYFLISPFSASIYLKYLLETIVSLLI